MKPSLQIGCKMLIQENIVSKKYAIKISKEYVMARPIYMSAKGLQTPLGLPGNTHRIASH